MASSDEDDRYWDAEKMLDLYLHDYLVKKKLHNSAAIFRREANVVTVPAVAIDGFLHEWWTIFYDIFASLQLGQIEHQEAQANSLVQTGQLWQNQLQNIHSIRPQLAENQHRPRQFSVATDDKMLAQPPRRFDQEQQLSHSISNLNPRILQWQIRNNQVQKLVQTQNRNANSVPRAIMQNRNANSIAGANHTNIIPDGAQQGTFPRTRSSGAGVHSNRWLSDLLMQTPHGAGPLSLTPANFCGRGLILSRTNSSGKDAQMMVQRKQNEDCQGRPNQHPQQQLPDNFRKRRRLSYSRAGNKNLGHADVKVDKPVDEIEHFLSTGDNKDDNEGTTPGTLKYTSTAFSKTEHKGFSFEEIGSLHSSKSKVLCCQFSCGGTFLASAGHDKKLFIWNMETFDFNDSSEEHSSLITDVRFRPNSTILATSSFDRTLRIWDATKPSKSILNLLGHAEQVMALDFHPRNVDLLCSCDVNDEIRLWNVNRGACIKISKQLKGATKQVRFQPQCGTLLATASGNSINLVDVDNDTRVQFNLKGHAKEVICLCWDVSGKYIASVSEDSARVWSLTSGGNCMHELLSNGNKFQSCAFHPGHSQLLMVGGYQSLELWNPIDGHKTRSVSAHKGLISALAGSLETQIFASASHDRCVKLWK